MTLPDGIRGQFTALALLAILLIVLFQLAVLPLFGVYRLRSDDLFSMRQDIMRYQHLLNERPALQELAESLQRDNPLDEMTLVGESPALAAADLQKRLQDQARRFGAKVVSLSILPPESDGPLQRIGVEARLHTRIQGLRDLLFAFESGQPVLFLEQLNVSARPVRRDHGIADDLDVRLVVYGLRDDREAPPVSGSAR